MSKDKKSSVSRSWVPPDHAADQGGLQKRVARGLTWTLLDQWGSQLLGLLIFVVLLRLLRPDEIGLVALAAALVAFAQLFVDQGFGDALIQRPSLTRGQIDTAFWTAVATGSLLMVVGIVLAQPIATVLGEPRLAPIVAALSLAPLLTAFDSIQLALLRREMAFRSLAMRRLSAVIVAGVVGMALAYLGFGAWALVAQQLIQALVSVVALWTVSPWRPGLSMSRKDFRSLLSFGVNIVAGDVLFYFSRNLDSLLIGTFLGPVPLGYYAVGFRVLDTSTSMLVQAARKLIFPTFARLQHDTERLRRAYARMNRLLATITFPGYLGMALVAQEGITVVFGHRWAPSVPVATVLVLIGPVTTLQAFSGGLLNGVGHPEVTLRFRFLATAGNVVGFAVAVLVFHEIVAVAWAYVIRGYILVPVILIWMRQYAGIPIRENLLRLRNIAAATLIMAVAVLAVKLAVRESVSTPVLLLAEVAVGVVVYGVSLLLLERHLLLELFGLGLQAIPIGEPARRVRLRFARSQPPLAIQPTPDEGDDVHVGP